MHNLTQHKRLRARWQQMNERCRNPKHKNFDRYGARGITVCPEWQSFPAFLAWVETSGFQPHLELDRANNDLGYSPDNCRWVTQAENKRNAEFTAKKRVSTLRNRLKVDLVARQAAWEKVKCFAVACVETGRHFISISAAARAVNRNPTALWRVLGKPERTCAGYHWSRC